jgi:hypothetical protein
METNVPTCGENPSFGPITLMPSSAIFLLQQLGEKSDTPTNPVVNVAAFLIKTLRLELTGSFLIKVIYKKVTICVANYSRIEYV